MERVVDIMVNLDLRFVQEKQEDGTLVYRLDPYVQPLNIYFAFTYFEIVQSMCL